MKSNIPTWTERCEKHLDHQSGMVTNAMILMRMQDEIDDLRARIAVLEGTLGWYAEPTNYAYQSVARYCGCCFDSMRHIDNDEGTRARAALAKQEKK